MSVPHSVVHSSNFVEEQTKSQKGKGSKSGKDGKVSEVAVSKDRTFFRDVLEPMLQCGQI